MKNTVFLFLLLFSYTGNSQSIPNEKIGVRGVLRGSAESKAMEPKGTPIQVKIPEVSEDMFYEIYFVDYKDGIKSMDELSMIFQIEVSKEKKKTIQVIPDISRKGHFILYCLNSGIKGMRHRFGVDNYFAYNQFKEKEKGTIGVEVPLLVVFENSSELQSAMSFFKKKEEEKFSISDLSKIISSKSPV